MEKEQENFEALTKVSLNFIKEFVDISSRLTDLTEKDIWKHFDGLKWGQNECRTRDIASYCVSIKHDLAKCLDDMNLLIAFIDRKDYSESEPDEIDFELIHEYGRYCEDGILKNGRIKNNEKES